MTRSIGIVECDCLSDVITAADKMVKAAEVNLSRTVQLGDSKIALIIDGDTADVKRALETADENPALSTDLIASVRPQVLSVFNLPGGGFFNVNRS